MSHTGYLGVYNNYDKPQCIAYRYRAALKTYKNGKEHYQHLGYFKSKQIAAYVYNIYALATCGQGALINPIIPTDEMNKEMMDSIAERDEETFLELIEVATVVLEENPDIRVYKAHETMGRDS